MRSRVGARLGSLCVVAAGFVFLALVLVSSANAKSPEYAGVEKCKRCHSRANLGGEEYPIWEKSKHAKVMELLKPGVAVEAKKAAKVDPQKDYTKDEKCLKCHTTGWGKPAEAKADLLNVQCEACHGPGSEYRKTTIMSKKKWQEDAKGMRAKAVEAGMIMPPTEEQCKQCHNSDSPFYKEFKFAERKAQIKHWKEKQ